MTGFKVTVEAQRRVACPEYGVAAFQTETHSKDFRFGKGAPYATGETARLAAHEYANTLLGKANEVSLVHWRGSNGRVQFLKQDKESRFATGWN